MAFFSSLFASLITNELLAGRGGAGRVSSLLTILVFGSLVHLRVAFSFVSAAAAQEATFLHPSRGAHNTSTLATRAATVTHQTHLAITVSIHAASTIRRNIPCIRESQSSSHVAACFTRASV